MEGVRQTMNMSMKGFCQVGVVLAGITYLVLAIAYLNSSAGVTGTSLECARQDDLPVIQQPGD